MEYISKLTSIFIYLIKLLKSSHLALNFIAIIIKFTNAFSPFLLPNPKENNKKPDMIPNLVEEEKENFWSLDEVERIIGYVFKDRTLLEQAFTHASYKDTLIESYERLEYVGDSVLNISTATDDYFSFPDLPPGKLTRLRAVNVDTEKLARVAVKHGLHKYLRHKMPLLSGQIEEFMEAIDDYPLHSSGLIDAPKVLADIVESTIGAIFIDTNSSLDITWKVGKKLLEPIITPEKLETHPMTKLYELCQRHGLKVKKVDLWSEKWTVEVFVENEFVGKGICSSKKFIALNRAANNAYNQLVRKLSLELVENVVLG